MSPENTVKKTTRKKKKKEPTKKELAFRLFDQGKSPIDPELKLLGLKGTTRYNYYDQWKKKKGVSPQPKEKVIDEFEMVLPHEDTEKVAENEKKIPESKVKLEQIQSAEEPRDEEEDEEDSSDEDEPVDSDNKESEPESNKKLNEGNGKKPSVMVPGKGLTFAITISTKTLALYQIAASQAEGELTIGDFIDICVEDTYRGRGLDLGLIRIGRNKNG